MQISNELFQKELQDIITEMNTDRIGGLEECENVLGKITLDNGEEVQVSVRVTRDIDEYED